MRTLWAALLALLALATLVAAEQMHIVTHDTGGTIGEYIATYTEMRERGDTLVIDGLCASSCTLFLGILPPSQIVITGNAEFKFHAAYVPVKRTEGTVINIVHSKATELMMSYYPSQVRRLLAERGGLSQDVVITISASEMNRAIHEY